MGKQPGALKERNDHRENQPSPALSSRKQFLWCVELRTLQLLLHTDRITSVSCIACSPRSFFKTEIYIGHMIQTVIEEHLQNMNRNKHNLETVT